MSKRKRFIISSLVLSLGFVGIQVIPDQHRIMSILLLSFATVVFFVWSLWEGLAFDMTILTLFLPFFYTLGVGFFWFLLPSSIFARFPVVILYGLGIYALCLTSNIYTVSAIRTIALLRAARGVGFVLTLFTLFLLFDTVLSLRWWVFYIAPIVVFLSFPVYFQAFWSFDLGKGVSKKVLMTTLVASIVMGEIVAILFFWPVSVVVGSLFLTVAAYVLLGLGQSELDGRLFAQTIREYLLVGISVFLGMFLATHWG
jgi:hypothetical protein